MHYFRKYFLVGIGILLLSQSGCVQRRLLIRSEPEGALVTVDKKTVGHTPVLVPFTYYGTRDIKLEKDGFDTVKVQQRVRAPWYEYPPISFFADNFAFREIRDTRALDFQLPPKTQTNEDQLIKRGSQLRQDVWRNTIVAPNR
jgi:hypothetical protein